VVDVKEDESKTPVDAGGEQDAPAREATIKKVKKVRGSGASKKKDDSVKAEDESSEAEKKTAEAESPVGSDDARSFEEPTLEDADVLGEDGEFPEDFEGDDGEAPEGFVFAMAPIVRLMREELDEDKMIRWRVKEGMNLWLEGMCRRATQKMNESEYTMVESDDFKTAIEPFEMIDEIEQERMRIVATLEKIKQDCDSLIMDVNRKFLTP